MLNYIDTFKHGNVAERYYITEIERGEHGHVLSVSDDRESHTLYYTVGYDCEESVMEKLEQMYADELDCPDTGRQRELVGYWDDEGRLSRFQIV